MFRSTNSNKRHCSQAENLPPSKLSSHRFDPLRSSRRRRAGVQSKYNLEQSKRRSQKQPVRFNVSCPVTKPTPSQPTVSRPAGRANVPVVLPRALGQPSRAEVTNEALRAAFGNHYDPLVPVDFIRDNYANKGLRLLATVISVSADIPKSKLPTEIQVLVHDDSSDDLPTHMLAVYGSKKSPSTNKVDVKLYPVHAPIMTAHCTKLPPFSPSPITSSDDGVPPATNNGIPRALTLPVRNLCLPHPSSFPHICQYLYARRAEILYNAFLPYPPSKCAQAFNEAGTATPSTSTTTSESSPSSFYTQPQNVSHQLDLASDLATTYTPHRLLESVAVVHGTWMNACALGIFDDTLWTVIDGCWEVLLRALAMGAGVELEEPEESSSAQ
ncbi:hypothetical protein E1B28_006348 [Marasmius oreades]|uniref:Clp1-like protein n=1 Tax=Marasmius oreades TaxID=181124 RepID=A0A9P7S562_9AGAR|nr:uncharacterized protein E1B28_006348 [Marasmius oreades]KAG7095624.1 hypothetical protein E1B28_006348 [Marasmius oreades]